MVAAMGGGTAFALTSYGAGQERLIEPAAPRDYRSGGAFAVGPRIHVAGTDTVAQVPGKVKALYYTSAGVVVRHGTDPDTDGPGPSDYALVTAQGEVRPLDLEGSFTWGGWVAPPVALSGDPVYVAVDDSTATSRAQDDTIRVLDLATGETLLTYPGDHFAYVSLSPDGRYAKVVLQDLSSAIDPPDVGEEDGIQVFNLDTGKRTTFHRPAWDLGWTPDGHLLGATDSEVTICVPDTVECATTEADHGRGPVKLGGFGYES